MIRRARVARNPLGRFYNLESGTWTPELQKWDGLGKTEDLG